LRQLSRSFEQRATIYLDFSLATTLACQSEEQGITIDVAAYLFQYPTKNGFHVADTPGHVEYTRNIGDGASTSQVAIILMMLVKGNRADLSAFLLLANLAFRISHEFVAINKMDLVN